MLLERQSIDDRVEAWRTWCGLITRYHLTIEHAPECTTLTHPDGSTFRVAELGNLETARFAEHWLRDKP